MSFTLELEISASTQEVFKFVSDFTAMPLWYSAVDRVQRLQGNGEVGTQYSVFRQLPYGAAVNDVVVTNYVKGEEITFKSISGPTPFTYQYRVQPSPHGTRLHLEGAISTEGVPWLASLQDSFVERIFKRGMRTNLENLKEILED